MVLAGWIAHDGLAGLEPQRQFDYSALPAFQVAADRLGAPRPGHVRGIAGLVPRGNDWLQVSGTLPRVRLVTARRGIDQDPARDIRRSTFARRP